VKTRKRRACAGRRRRVQRGAPHRGHALARRWPGPRGAGLLGQHVRPWPGAPARGATHALEATPLDRDRDAAGRPPREMMAARRAGLADKPVTWFTPSGVFLWDALPRRHSLAHAGQKSGIPGRLRQRQATL